MSAARIVADVGGTNVRFAVARDGKAGEAHSYPARQFPTFVTALALYLLETGNSVDEGVAIGAAGPVDEGRTQLTNADWVIEESAVSAAFGKCRVRLVNDVEAVAYALPALQPSDVEAIGPWARDAAARRAMLAVNVGTGFGAAAVVPANGGWVAVPGEAGHMALAWDGQFITVEDVLSGRGLAALYSQTGAAGDGGAKALFSSFESEAEARGIVEAFGCALGKVAGDLALATGAWGGVYFCGSVVDAWRAAGAPGQFRAGFEQKGAMSARMKQIYTGCILREHVALAGLARVPLS